MKDLIVLIAAAVLTLFFGGIFFGAHIKGKNMYNDYKESIDKKDFSLRDLIHIGLYINEHLNIKEKLPIKIQNVLAKSRVETRGKLSLLYGERYLDFYEDVNEASKTTILFLLPTLTSFAAMLMAANNSGEDGAAIMIIGILIGFAAYFFWDTIMDGKIKKKTLSIQMEFPDFLNRLLLLVNAGMTLSRAFEKIMEDNKKDTPLYRELSFTYYDIKSGKSESIALEDFARRCKIREVINFVSVMVQNLKKGGAEVVPALQEQSRECWEMRKTAAKQLGEEAGSKLIFPLMMVFVGILILVGAPAMFMMSNL